MDLEDCCSQASRLSWARMEYNALLRSNLGRYFARYDNACKNIGSCYQKQYCLETIIFKWLFKLIKINQLSDSKEIQCMKCKIINENLLIEK